MYYITRVNQLQRARDKRKLEYCPVKKKMSLTVASVGTLAPILTLRITNSVSAHIYISIYINVVHLKRTLRPHVLYPSYIRTT